jgi:RNA polymerase sigma factor (sigma-70 family)
MTSYPADLSGAFQAYRPDLLRLLIARTVDRCEAEDLLQDVWVKLQRSPPEQVQDLKSYMFRMAQNLMIDRLRARQRRMVRERRWSDEATDFARSPDEHVADARTAEDELAEREEVATLVSAISNLPSGARQVLELHKFQGLSHAQVAASLGISTSGVEKHMAVAMKHLRRALID